MYSKDDECLHDFVEIDDIWGDETFWIVKCIVCGIRGEFDTKTGETIYPCT